MEITFKKKGTHNAKTLHVTANVRYWEDSTVNDIEDTDGDLIPCRIGESWCPIIDIDLGKIINWEIGKTADIHYKVCDAGLYIVKNENDEIIIETDGYVPNIMCPEGGGYGDYIIMKVDANGVIENWNKTPNKKDFK